MPEKRRELLGGCGRRRERNVQVDGIVNWSNLTTLDINPDHEPDVVWDLEKLPLPFPDDYFDEAHFYEVLEHTGQQGDAAFFFGQFEEFWRILKPGGVLCGTVPDWRSPWAWGDPSHKRVITAESLMFLEQVRYSQVGMTPMSDFRSIYRADFAVEMAQPHGRPDAQTLVFSLRAIKPARLAG